MPSQIRQQWENEIKLWDSTAKIIYGGGDGSNWRDLLPNQLGVYRLGRDPSADMQRTFVLCTYDTIGMDDFVGLFEGIPSRFVQVIGDEVHHFAGQVANAFNIQADRVLGLSATHTRHWDDPGTAEIERHFGKPVYEFDIQDGIINNYLCHYNYHIHFVDMTSNELGEYTNLSGKIGFKEDQIKKAKSAGQPVSALQGELSILRNQRTRILRKAQNKPDRVGEILLNHFSGNQEKAIIFCEDTEQVDKIKEILVSQNKSYTEISNRLSTEQKKAALKEFKETVASRFLLGINMLDEGLDVPESDKCIIVASTTNPRQFIQRRGRVLRISTTNPNKVAEVHDTIVVPNYSVPGGQLSKDQEKEAERMAKIINKEIIRLHQMMNAADNKAAVTADLSNWIQRHRLQDYVTS
jgi:superfamily II DNA or RNA helicase